MDYQSIVEVSQGILIKNVENFELNHIFDCGQCFRWNKEDNGNYIGVAFGKVLEVEKIGQDVMLYNTNQEEFYKNWLNYFDLDRDYSKIKNVLSEDDLLRTAVEFGDGIRLLQQESFELVISFIISSNNRIPMIKRAINKISSIWGDKVQYKGQTYYSFPSLERLHEATLEELQACSIGFRAKYIKETVEKIYLDGERLNNIITSNDDECHKNLQNYDGIGPKVADCIMLFSMGKYSAFPVDVWVKRAMQHFYLAPDVSLKKIREFARGKFGNLSGFAQQYLFYYARENNVKI